MPNPISDIDRQNQARVLGDSATINGVSCFGIFERPFLLVEGVEQQRPTLRVPDVDLPVGDLHGAAVVVVGVFSGTVDYPEPDGRGWTTLVLKS